MALAGSAKATASTRVARMLLRALIGPPPASCRRASSCSSYASSWRASSCASGLLGLDVAGALEVGRGRCVVTGGVLGGWLAGRFACADRRHRRFGEPPAFAVVVDVVVFVGVPAGKQAIAGREEDVAAVGGGIDQVAFIAALARRRGGSGSRLRWRRSSGWQRRSCPIPGARTHRRRA